MKKVALGIVLFSTLFLAGCFGSIGSPGISEAPPLNKQDNQKLDSTLNSILHTYQEGGLAVLEKEYGIRNGVACGLLISTSGVKDEHLHELAAMTLSVRPVNNYTITACIHLREVEAVADKAWVNRIYASPRPHIPTD